MLSTSSAPLGATSHVRRTQAGTGSLRQARRAYQSLVPARGRGMADPPGRSKDASDDDLPVGGGPGLAARVCSRVICPTNVLGQCWSTGQLGGRASTASVTGRIVAHWLALAVTLKAFSPRDALEWDSEPESESAKSLAIRILVLNLKLGLLARIFCGRDWDLADAPPANLAMLSLLTFVALGFFFRGPGGGKGRARPPGPRRGAALAAS